MARITIDVPDSLAQYHLDAFAALHNYNAATDGTKYQFFVRFLSNYIESTTISHFTSIAAEEAASERYNEIVGIVRGSVVVT